MLFTKKPTTGEEFTSKTLSRIMMNSDVSKTIVIFMYYTCYAIHWFENILLYKYD